jgi:tRNA-splicing ligase RtcB
MANLTRDNLVQLDKYLWEVPRSYRTDMRVPARLYASERMLDSILADRSLDQLINVATLPGIYKYALVMPDVHEGYGFPIGGVAATFYPEGLISPGGIGYDINCGVRLLVADVSFTEIEKYLEALSQEIYRQVPSGVGRGGWLKLDQAGLSRVLERGARWMVEEGYGEADDLTKIESNGYLEGADASLVSEHARKRGKDQLGTMGAGNHFVEVQRVAEIFDPEIAAEWGLFENQLAVMIHTGSRGLGHQIATDYIRKMVAVMPRYGIQLPDRELAGVPLASPEGENYFKAMQAGANFAWANRQLITWEVRRAWRATVGESGGGLKLLYDVAHNIAKIEDYDDRRLIVHRKGATRAFPGQPVLIPGSMGTASYVLVGQKESLNQSFGSTCHGAGRRMSRHAAKRSIRGSELKNRLTGEGVYVQAGSLSGLAEEAPEAYKNVTEVVEVVHGAGIAKKVARLRPVAVIKG